jgi:stage II sporulation protein D
MRKNIKKFFIYLILLVVLIKCFGIVFLNKSISTSSKSNEIISKYEKFDYGDYSNIKLLHTDSGEIENLELDKYLYGVVCAEMPASFELEALKAQATVARTYTIYKIKNGSKHLDVRC